MMKNVCRWAIVAVSLIHLLKNLVAVDLQVPLFVFALLLLVSGLPLQGAGFRKITLLFLAAGGAIAAAYGLPFTDWMQSLVSMTNVIAIIVVMQFFTMPIELGNYSQSVEYWFKKSFKKESSLFFFTMLVTHIFASFLLFGTVPVMVSLFDKALKNSISNYQRFLAAAIVRAYAMVLFWSPAAVIMLLVMQITNVSWFDLFVPGFILSVIGIVTAYLLEHFTRLNKPIAGLTQAAEASAETAQLARTQGIHIAVVVLGLLVCVGAFEKLAIGTGTGRILLAGLLVAGGWLLYYRSHVNFRSAFRKQWENGVIKASDLSVFFIAMGLFAGAVDKSGILTAIQPALQQSVNYLGVFSIVAVPVVFVLLAVLGIHPFILTVIFGKLLLALSLPVSTVAIAILLLLSSAISFIASPFAGMVLMTAKFLEVKPFEVAVKWNSVYSVLVLAEGVAFAVLWG